MKKYLTYLTKPFEENLRFFLFLFVISTSILCLNVLLNNSLWLSFVIALSGWIQCYLLCLLIPIFKRWKTLYKVFLLVLGFLSFTGDLLMSFVNEVRFKLFGGVILGTNISEALEFLGNLISWKDALFGSLFICFVIILWILLKFLHPNHFLSCIGYTFVIISIPLISINYKNWILQGTFMGKYAILIVEKNKSDYNLKDYYSNPKLTRKGSNPKNIIIVIGESFSKGFSSLYGYEKKTNPLLSTISNNNLHIFNNVTSAYVTTIPSIKTIMSTFSNRINENDWYKCVTLPEILHKIGYKTYWISNQFEGGIFDNITTKYANLCDSTIFAGTRFAVNAKTQFDEVVLPHLSNICQKEDSLKVIFVHLYGSHSEFRSRYPNDRSYFKENDYLKYPKYQRDKRSTYDNSILYNDSIIYEIFKEVENKESICFYFSDHGIDLYQTKNSVASHAIRSDSTSVRIAQDIPFIIYTSKLYNKHYPQNKQRISSSVDKKFITQDFIYSLMDIMGIYFSENEDVQKYSLFNNLNK